MKTKKYQAIFMIYLISALFLLPISFSFDGDTEEPPDNFGEDAKKSAKKARADAVEARKAADKAEANAKAAIAEAIESGTTEDAEAAIESAESAIEAGKAADAAETAADAAEDEADKAESAAKDAKKATDEGDFRGAVVSLTAAKAAAKRAATHATIANDLAKKAEGFADIAEDKAAEAGVSTFDFFSVLSFIAKAVATVLLPGFGGFLVGAALTGILDAAIIEISPLSDTVSSLATKALGFNLVNEVINLANGLIPGSMVNNQNSISINPESPLDNNH